jgi:hypothetical protein
MSDWDEFERRVAAWQQEGDTERLKLAELHDEAFRYRETDPEHQFELFTRGRDEAQRLNEPWWVLFFERWRLSTLTADLHDFARALPLAMELMVRFNKPDAQAHPERVDILISVLYTYLQIDPIGYRDELERGFAYLDNQISRGPVTERFVLDFRRAEYLSETERWQEAFEQAHRSLALADRSGDFTLRNWHGAWSLFQLCEICHALGRLDDLAAHAQDMADRSEWSDECVRTKASACFWLAVAQRARGDQRAASRSFRRGTHYLKNLETRDEICADPMAKYYELGADFKAAVGVRDREVDVVTKKGMLHRSSRVQIERCRLLKRAAEITPADISNARQAIAKMRVPDWYLEKLGRIGAT